MYKRNPACYGEMFAIPASVADNDLTEATGDALKTLLRIFRAPNDPISVDALSGDLGLSADQILKVLDFWVQKGVLLFTDESGNIKYVPKAKADVQSGVPARKPTDTQAPASPVSIPKPTMEQIAARIREDENVRGLLTEVQAILGRTFGLDMQTTLLTLFDTYGLQKEVILTLVQHLCETGRGATATILRIGKSWAEQEITTLDAANEYIRSDTQVQRLFAQFRMATGISNPRPTAKQTEYLLSWCKMHFSLEMILKAYEETAERTGKLSFAYMDKILKHWDNEGLRTPEAVDAARQAAAVQKKQENGGSSFDLDEALKKATISSKRQKKAE